MTFDQRVKRVMQPEIERLESLYLPSDFTGSTCDLRPIIDKLDQIDKLVKQLKDETKKEPSQELSEGQKRRKKYERKRLLEWLRDNLDALIYEWVDLPESLPEPVKTGIYYFLDWLADSVIELIPDELSPWLDALPVPDIHEGDIKRLPQSFRFGSPRGIIATPVVLNKTYTDSITNGDILKRLIQLHTFFAECCASMKTLISEISGGQSEFTRILIEMRRRCP